MRKTLNHSLTHKRIDAHKENSGIFSSVSFWQFFTPTCTDFSLPTGTLWMLSSCSTCCCVHLFKDPSWLFNEKDLSWLNGTTDTHRAKVQTALWIFNSCQLMNVSTASCQQLEKYCRSVVLKSCVYDFCCVSPPPLPVPEK